MLSACRWQVGELKAELAELRASGSSGAEAAEAAQAKASMLQSALQKVGEEIASDGVRWRSRWRPTAFDGF